MEAETAARLGAVPTVMPVSMLADALAKGAVDAAIISPTGLFQFGAAGAAKNHFQLTIGTAPLLVVMSEQKFEGLPEPAKALIRKYSGEWAAAKWTALFAASEKASLDKIRSDPARSAVEPSAADQKAAQAIYTGLLQGWAAKSPANAKIVGAIEAELAALRASKQ
jgi:TRAP-type C4-dicarboxylate transport system substrate-binding protein